MSTHPIRILLFAALSFLALAALLAWSATHVTTQTATASQLYEPDSLSQVSQVTNAPLQTATPTACGLAWRFVPSPNFSGFNNLNDVAAISSNDVWAVGNYTDANGTARALIIHWDGIQWNMVNWSEAGINDPILVGIDALAANDVWVVGSYGGGARTTLVLHWDGVEWSRVPSPNPTNDSRFHSVSALSSNDIWAVGYTIVISGGFGVDQTLTEHWDGTQWSVVPSPNVSSQNNLLRGVTVVSSNDVWAVGLYHESNYDRTLILHWDGIEWSVVPAPQVGYDQPFGIEAISANDIWIVGRSFGDTLILHWDGVQWSHVPSPNFEGQINELFAVEGTGPNDVWAVGNHCDCAIKDWNLVIHWDGVEWSVVSSPSPGVSSDKFFGVSVLNSGEVWAVGWYNSGSAYRTLTERYSDPCLTLTPTPTSITTATATPLSTFSATSTRTSTAFPPTWTVIPEATTVTPASSTPVPPTSTTTPCPITFTDVDTDNPFYAFIRCLACRSIISGYTDGTFRPNNDISRGQIAKMVSNSAGFSEDPGTQIYEDVPTESPFYSWINRLSMRGHMGGYNCGLIPEEPCGLESRPYFRPSASATRGQLAKIVANAAGLGVPPSGIFYTDVQEDNPFYVWVMRLTKLNVMSGYPCGGENEPCDESNRPYFRPFNTVTRGQASKIVANTFFPACQIPSSR